MTRTRRDYDRSGGHTTTNERNKGKRTGKGGNVGDQGEPESGHGTAGGGAEMALQQLSTMMPNIEAEKQTSKHAWKMDMSGADALEQAAYKAAEKAEKLRKEAAWAQNDAADGYEGRKPIHGKANLNAQDEAKLIEEKAKNLKAIECEKVAKRLGERAAHAMGITTGLEAATSTGQPLQATKTRVTGELGDEDEEQMMMEGEGMENEAAGGGDAGAATAGVTGKAPPTATTAAATMMMDEETTTDKHGNTISVRTGEPIVTTTTGKRTNRAGGLPGDKHIASWHQDALGHTTSAGKKARQTV